MKKMSTTILTLLLGLLLAACASVDKQEPKDYEEEGLDTVQKTSRSELYIRPDIALPLYKKLYIEPITVSYSSQKHTNITGQTEADFQLDDNELAVFRQQIIKAVSEVWNTSIENRTVVETLEQVKPSEVSGDEQYPETTRILIMKISITDLYLFASIKNNQPGRTTTLLDESSKMVINMDLLDAESGEVLLRSIDHRTTGYRSGPKRQFSSVVYFNDVYQTFRSWINQLSARLD